jgi:lipopolysaccharide transport system permease protein
MTAEQTQVGAPELETPGNISRHEQTVKLIPNRKIEGFGFEELWAYRELIWGLVHRDLMAIKNQSPIAWFWRVLAPTFSIITYTILFEQIGKVDFGMDVPYFFVMSAAMLPWNLVSQIILGAVTSVSANASFFTKIYFPRMILPMVSVTNAVIDFVITAVLLLGLLFYMGRPLSANLLAVPFFAIWALLLGLGFGLWLAALNAIYRDVSYSLAYILNLAFFVSPIVYPASAIPERFRDIYHLNPFVGIVEGFRWSFLGKGDPPDPNDVVAFGFTCLFVLSGIWFFRKVERVFADIV